MFHATGALIVPTRDATVDKSMLGEISRLRRMTVGDLRGEWFRLYGQPTASRNRDYLWRRLAWRLQELAHGGLSDRARNRIAELAPAGFVRAVTPRNPAPVDLPVADAARPRSRSVRDIRLPSAGTVITRTWRGRELRLLVLDAGFEMDGVHYGSLSEAARAVTGQRWNGPLYWGLRERKRRK